MYRANSDFQLLYQFYQEHMMLDAQQSKMLHQYEFHAEYHSFDAATLMQSFNCVMNTPIDLLSKEIEKRSHELHSLFGCDQVLLWEVFEDRKGMYRLHSWEMAGNDPGNPPQDMLTHDNLPYIVSRICGLQDLCVSRLQELPSEAQIDKKWLDNQGIRSIIAVPLFVDGAPRGALSLAYVNKEHQWSEEDIATIKSVGSIFEIAFARKRFEKLHEQRLQFEKLLSDLSAKLIVASTTNTDANMEQALDQVRNFFNGDRCILIAVDGSGSTRVSYGSYGKGLEPVSGDTNLADIFPWSYDRLVVQGQHINISSRDDLPAEAEAERESWSAFGIYSLLSVPILVEENVVLILAISTVFQEQFWNDEYISRLRLLGEICLGALKRRDADSAVRQGRVRLQAQIRELEQLKEKITDENIYLYKEKSLLFEHSNIIAESKKMKDILRKVEQVAYTDSTVLITGETGTGKELFAQHIHKLSRRKGLPMVTVNCACLQPTLIESELFGREKGAYTGAMTKMAGRFEVADGSTIFLDEIGELPLELQSKLLRVLEEGTFERLGSTKTVRVDVRVIAASNRDLLQDVRRGAFRHDLFYRLNVFPIFIPPLREHIEDLAALVWLFVRQFEKKMGRQIDAVRQDSMEALKTYYWPGNIREMRNVVEHAMIVSRDRTLVLSQPAAVIQEEPESCDLELETVEREHILKVLLRCNWRVSGQGGTAEALGLNRTTLQSKMKKLGIKHISSK